MIVFDAGVLIAFFDPHDAFHAAANDFIDEHEHAEFVASVLTVSEALVRPAANGRAGTLKAGLDRLGLLRIDVGEEDIVPLAEVRAATRLRMPDALVLLGAERHGAELVTTDEVLARAAAERGVTAHVLAAV
ncbi:MAG: PIN domain-containing protein [Microbacterium sp.]|uniref:type II toxin-antitoxin system VapC family toxin n=1 Tax=Microbacterium sp. TaxID=51671 RepID=UPI0039E489F8